MRRRSGYRGLQGKHLGCRHMKRITTPIGLILIWVQVTAGCRRPNEDNPKPPDGENAPKNDNGLARETMNAWANESQRVGLFEDHDFFGWGRGGFFFGGGGGPAEDKRNQNL